MPTKEQTAPIGSNFTGAFNLGEVLFDGLSPTDDTQRAVIYSIAVQSSEVSTNMRFRLAKSLADANGAGPFEELANSDDVSGLQNLCCECVVPKGYNLYVVTTGPVLAAKYLVVDWRRNTMLGRM